MIDRFKNETSAALTTGEAQQLVEELQLVLAQVTA